MAPINKTSPPKSSFQLQMVLFSPFSSVKMCWEPCTSNLTINEDHFVFDNIFYRQKKGLLIGSQISGILAEMKIRILKEQIKIRD